MGLLLCIGGAPDGLESPIRLTPSCLKAVYKAQLCLDFWGSALPAWWPEAQPCTPLDILSIPAASCKITLTPPGVSLAQAVRQILIVTTLQVCVSHSSL